MAFTSYESYHGPDPVVAIQLLWPNVDAEKCKTLWDECNVAIADKLRHVGLRRLTEKAYLQAEWLIKRLGSPKK